MSHGKNILWNFAEHLMSRLARKSGVDLPYYIHNALFLLIVDGVSVTLGLLSSLAFTRLISKETYGQYNYIFSIISLVLIASLPGMNTAINRAVARGYDSAFMKGTLVRMKWSLLGSLILLSVAIYYYFNNSPLLASCFVLSAIFFPIYSCTDTFQSFLQAKRLFKTDSIYRSTIIIVSTLTVVLVLYLSRNLLLVMTASLASTSLARVYFIRRIGSKNEQSQDADSEAIAYGKRLTLMGIIPMIASQYDKIIIANFIGFEDLAIYSVALLAENIGRPIGTIMELSFPKLAAMHEHTAVSALNRRMVNLLLIGAVICSAAIVVIPFFIPLMFTEKYSPSILYAQIIIAAQFISIPGSAYSTLFKSQARTRKLLVQTLASYIIKIATLSILVPLFGLLGAALASVVSNFTTGAIGWLLAKRRVAGQ